MIFFYSEKVIKLINKKQIFNPNGQDSLQARKIIGGNSTNLFNLNSVKYSWAKPLYRVLLANFWIPEKIDLTPDVQQYENLSEKEKSVFKSILSFLTFLDSIQTNNVPKISEFITAPEISTLLGIQMFQEIIHSQSYAYIIESVIPIKEREQVYEEWRTNQVLFKRNEYIASVYQSFWDNQPTAQNPLNEEFAKVIIANYILEGLYFYNGFIFFYNLASRNTMMGVADEIRYINRDEKSHIDLFANIILTLQQEYPGFITEELVKEMFDFACQEEIKWMNYILKDSNIVGMDKVNTEKYTKYLVNSRLEQIGYSPLYPEFNENPYSYLEMVADSNGDSVKSNFFESGVTNYSQSSALEGWDEI